MKTAFVFPGQGSQYVGMGKDFRDSGAGDLFSTADGVLGYPLSAVCFEGPEEALKQTENTQPAIFVHSLTVASAITSLTADMVAGHSLGEYSALVHACALSFEDALCIVRLRGRSMQRAGEMNKGTMAAIVGVSKEEITAMCTQASAAGIVGPANFNSPGQVVISGSVEGVRKAMELAKGRGAKLVKELVVSGAFHSPLMESARDELRQALAATEIQDARIPVYMNVTGEPVTDAKEIRELLVQQVTSPVRWEESVQHMVRDGAGTFVEVGPGKVLQGLVKRTDATVKVCGFDKYTDVSIALA